MRSRQEIAEQILSEMLGQSVSLQDGIFAPCPGAGRHTTPPGRKDFRVTLDGAPTGYCLHKNCGEEVDRFNKELRRQVWFEENGRSASAPRGHWGEGVAPAPKQDVKTRPQIDMYQVWEFTRGVPEVDFAWCRWRSPVDVLSVGSAEFLGHLYGEDERVLIFTDQRSQGDFIAWKRPGELLADGLTRAHEYSGDGGHVETFRLSQQRGVKAVPSRLPTGGRDGVWFLVQPVSGQWVIRRDVTWEEEAESWKKEVKGIYSRRSQGNVTAWRYFVLESDDLPAEEWLKVLANLKLPIAAIYTSGGRSIHALLRLEVSAKAEWDLVRNDVRQMLCPLGADPAALTAVRLSRLPGCKRGERMQELLYLDPAPDGVELRLKPEVRG